MMTVYLVIALGMVLVLVVTADILSRHLKRAVGLLKLAVATAKSKTEKNALASGLSVLEDLPFAAWRDRPDVIKAFYRRMFLYGTLLHLEEHLLDGECFSTKKQNLMLQFLEEEILRLPPERLATLLVELWRECVQENYCPAVGSASLSFIAETLKNSCDYSISTFNRLLGQKLKECQEKQTPSDATLIAAAGIKWQKRMEKEI